MSGSLSEVIRTRCSAAARVRGSIRRCWPLQWARRLEGVGGGLGRLGPDHQAQANGSKASPRLVEFNALIEPVLGFGLVEQSQPVEPPARLIGQLQAVPGQPDQHVGAAVERVFDAVGLGKGAVGQPDLAVSDGQPVEALAPGQRRQFGIGHAALNRIVAQVQAPRRVARSFDPAAVHDLDSRAPRQRRVAQAQAPERLGAQSLHPRRGSGQPVEQGDIRHVGQFPLRRERGAHPQGVLAGAVQKGQTQQIAGAANAARPKKSTVLPRRGRKGFFTAELRDHRAPLVGLRWIEDNSHRPQTRQKPARSTLC